ncbi:hypothetical protein CYMTET_49520 [Cymbomonas tetramitiformis]|uniref:Uncharacterized protein n=1 Tax=Cymbomonas tetramitiformis TaxID=36881 RepID=A0AAE0BPX4_9CHLO|nr:hypothetical protein CYMTET_49520 [Cymbomonas tetramitiformis]
MFGEGIGGKKITPTTLAQRELPIERMLGTALILAYLDISRMVMAKQVEGQLRRAQEVYWERPTARPITWYVDVFKAMLATNGKRRGWYERSVLWNLLFLQSTDGSFDISGALATVLAAGDTSENLRLDASTPIDPYELKLTLPAVLMQTLQGTQKRNLREKVWATCCALECYYRLPFGFILNPQEVPSEQRTLAQLGEHFLVTTCETEPDLSAALPAVRETAARLVDEWQDSKIEAIKALRQECIDNEAAVASEMSKWEQRALRMTELKRLVTGALNNHPWAAIRSVSVDAVFSRSQRILVEANKLMVMLLVNMLLQYNRGLGCCVSFKTHLGCEAATISSDCHGVTTCAELYDLRDKEGLPREVYQDSRTQPNEWQCTAFPDENNISHQIYAVAISVIIMAPMTIYLTTLFILGGSKLVPNHWTKGKTVKKTVGGEGSKSLWFLRNMIFLGSLFLAKQQMAGQLLVRYFVYFSRCTERAAFALARVGHKLYASTKRLRVTIWFLSETLLKGRDPAALLETLEVLEQKEKEAREAELDAAATFTVASSELNSFPVQLAYVSLALMWALTVWFLLTFAMLIRSMLGDGAENTIVFLWLSSVAVDVLGIHLARGVALHLAKEKYRERKLMLQSKSIIVMEWYEDYISKYLNTAYCRDLEEMIEEEMMASGDAKSLQKS